MARTETLYATNDLDGVHFVAPPPLKTMSMLKKGKPLIDAIFVEPSKISSESGIAALPGRIYHGLRPFSKDSAVYLQMLKDARDAHQRDLKIAVLTGRRGAVHESTKNRMEKRYPNTFDYYFLNDTDSATKFKESMARQIVSAGNSLVHIDDDLRAALGIARVGQDFPEQNVLVYLKSNLSNSPQLLENAGIQLPENIILVSSLRAAGFDLLRRVRIGEL